MCNKKNTKGESDYLGKSHIRCLSLAKSVPFLNLNFRLEISTVKSLRDMQVGCLGRNQSVSGRDTMMTSEPLEKKHFQICFYLNNQVHLFSNLRILSSFPSHHCHDNTSALQKHHFHFNCAFSYKFSTSLFTHPRIAQKNPRGRHRLMYLQSGKYTRHTFLNTP